MTDQPMPVSRPGAEQVSAVAGGGEIAGRMAAAAQAWLGTLTPEQRDKAAFAQPGPEADAERTRWFYTPTDHGGLTLGAQSPAQQQAAMTLVSTGVSESGYVAISTIMGLENVLDRLEGWAVDWGRERGRDPGMYFLSVFGDPGSAVWGWRFGGHHVSLNNLVVDGRLASITPMFLGADPARSPLPGNAELRPLAPVEDLALRLADSFDTEQRRLAVILDRAVPDIVGGNRPDIADGDQMLRVPDLLRGRFTDPRLADFAESLALAMDAGAGYGPDEHARIALTTAPAGLPGRSLSASQKDLLQDLLSCYFDCAPAPVARHFRNRYLGEHLSALHFACAGTVLAGDPLYYRIHGPQLLIEYDNTQRMANHVHSVWRNLGSDFGVDTLARHHAHFHSGPDGAATVRAPGT